MGNRQRRVRAALAALALKSPSARGGRRGDDAALAQPEPDLRVDLKVPITLAIELTEDVIDARAMLNLASGEIEGPAKDWACKRPLSSPM